MEHQDDLTGWTPATCRYDAAGPPTVEWRRLGGLRLADPFFDDTLRKALGDRELGALRRQTSVEALGAFVERHPGLAPTGLIFHMSRCGSTLLSQLLASVPSVVMVSEAAPIDAVVQAPIEEDQRVRHLRWLVGALGQRRLGSERTVLLKLDAWHAPHIPLFQRAFAGVPWVFVYREPAAVLASHARQRGMHMVPGLIDARPLGLEPGLFPRVSLDAYGAHVLAAFGEAALRAHAGGGGTLVHYRELPERVEGELAALFGLHLAPGDREAMRAAAGFHSKRPDVPFARGAVDTEIPPPDTLLRVCEQVCGDVYRRLEAARSGKAVPVAAAPGFSPARDPEPRAPPSSLRLPIAVDLDGLRADLTGIADTEFVPHFNDGYFEGDWSGVSLRSVGGKASQIYPDPSRKDSYADTPVLARCPHVRALLSSLRCPLRAVRFLRLGAGSSIKEHHDPDLGFALGEVRLHVPVTSNPDVELVLGGVAAPMREGECWYHDFGLPHRVENRGVTARTHLVVDCVLDDWLRELFATASLTPSPEG